MRTLAFLGISDWHFSEPVFIGDTIRIRAKVLEKEERGARPARRHHLAAADRQPGRQGRAGRDHVTLVEGRAAAGDAGTATEATAIAEHRRSTIRMARHVMIRRRERLDCLRCPLNRLRRREPRFHDRSAPVSLPARPATCTSAASAPPCSTGCSRAGTAASSSCASTTPTPSAIAPKRCSRSSTASAGSASTGTKARRSAGRTAPISSRSASSSIARPP